MTTNGPRSNTMNRRTVYTGCGKQYFLKLFAIFWATAWNFITKFHTCVTCL